MTGRPQRRSLFEERAASTSGSLGLAAATAAAHVARLISGAKKESGLSHRELAERMTVSEGRVSQIVGGDGNFHIATIARVLRAMGYELDLRATPVEPDRNPLPATERRVGRRRTEAVASYEIYEQTFLTGDGPMKVPMLVPADDTLRSTPYGKPAYAGRLSVSATRGAGHVRRVPPRREAWQAAVEIKHVPA